MFCTKRVDEELVWIGGNDRRLNLFENIIPVPEGISYNSYILLDEKTVLFDTVDRSITDLYLENIEATLAGRKLDYIVVNHMEPDHCATLTDVMLRYPEAKIVGNVKTFQIVEQLYHELDLEARTITVKEGDSLTTGKHKLSFYLMPMVHWPEVMATYDETTATLFSADAFGSFGTLNGHIFADEFDFELELAEKSRRYYTNIVGKYGPQVQNVFKKIKDLKIDRICPLHGPVWRENVSGILDLYQHWSTYTPEESGVVIAYASIYGNTENAAEILACRLADKGVRKISMYDVSVTDPSYIISDSFKYSHLVLASSTYNNLIFPKMETLVSDLKGHNLQNRRVAILQNGTWAPSAGKSIDAIIKTMKGMEVIAPIFTVKSSLAPNQQEELEAWANLIAYDILDERTEDEL